MERFRAIFQGVEDPRKSNAKKHDLNEMLMIALLATLAGKSSCSSFARYAGVKQEFLSERMRPSPRRRPEKRGRPKKETRIDD